MTDQELAIIIADRIRTAQVELSLTRRDVSTADADCEAAEKALSAAKVALAGAQFTLDGAMMTRIAHLTDRDAIVCELADLRRTLANLHAERLQMLLAGTT